MPEDTPFPDLPEDLVRVIFEIAAQSDLETSLPLVRVSKLVHRWIDPLLFSMVNIDYFVGLEGFCHAIESTRDLAFWQKNVKCLVAPAVFPSPLIYRLHIINALRNNADTLGKLQPCQISWSLTLLSDLILENPSVARVTHVNIVHDEHGPDYAFYACRLLPPLKCLRYLSIDTGIHTPNYSSDQVITLAGQVLEECPRSLQVMVVRVSREIALNETEYLEVCLSDPRAVFEFRTRSESGHAVRRTGNFIETNLKAEDDNSKWRKGGYQEIMELAEQILAEQMREREIPNRS